MPGVYPPGLTADGPQNTVLVLGRELTGIPDGGLSASGIPVSSQYALVVSRNGPTAAAIAIDAYIHQGSMVVEL